MPDGKTDGHIEVYSGEKYTPNGAITIGIEDIAHSLGNQCRFTGHCRHFYSVAEHSVLCSLLSEELGLGSPFEALMHDAHEAVISDMASPWKQFLPDYRTAEKVAAQDLRARYGLPPVTTEEIRKVDYLALFIEAYYLMRSKGEGWVDPLSVRVEALRLVKRNGWRVHGLEPSQAKNAFLRRFHSLLPEGRKPQWWENQDVAEA